MKNSRNAFLSLVLGIILFFGSMGIAQAQPVPPNSIISFSGLYENQQDQLDTVELLKGSDYTVFTPLDFKEIIANLPKGGSLDGSFYKITLDFQDAKPQIPGTDRLFSIDAFGTGTDKLYSVVAGKLLGASCPIKIEDTQVAFVSTEQKAREKTEELVAQDYLVYVTPDSAAQKKALIALKQTGCHEIDGATKKVTVDFKDVSYILAPDFDQQANQGPFIYTPKGGDFIYAVNASKLPS